MRLLASKRQHPCTPSPALFFAQALDPVLSNRPFDPLRSLGSYDGQVMLLKDSGAMWDTVKPCMTLGLNTCR